MEGLGEIWMAKARGQEGQVETDIMHYCKGKSYRQF